MRFFSRNQDAVEPDPVDDVAFESLRAPRGARKGRGTVDSRMDATVPLDPAEAAKARARRRLIGAIALALAAVVFVPMLFDRAPPSPADDIAVQIPDRDAPFEGRRGVPDPNKGPLRPSSALPSVTPPAADKPQASSTAVPPLPVDAAKGANAELSSKPAAGAPVDKTATTAPDSSSPKGPDKNSAAPSSTALPADDPRALAALEGKTVSSSSPDAASTKPAGQSFAVQVAALSDPSLAYALRDELRARGFKAYTELQANPRGALTRVRAGPYLTRDEAERARQKLKTMKFEGSVVSAMRPIL